MPRLIKHKLEAGQESRLAISGDYFRVFNASNRFQVFFDGAGEETTAVEGTGFPIAYDSLRLLSEVSQTVEIYAGRGRVDDNRQQGNVTLNLPSNMSTALETVNAATERQIVLEDSARKTIMVKSDAGNADGFFVGDAAGECFYFLGPGDEINLAYSGALFVRNAGAAAVTVYVAEMF